jgi:hypothetical protein
MDNVQKHNNCINILSLQTFKTGCLPISFFLTYDHDVYLLQIQILGYTAMQEVKNAFLVFRWRPTPDQMFETKIVDLIDLRILCCMLILCYENCYENNIQFELHVIELS